jgi:hypothetical protein
MLAHDIARCRGIGTDAGEPQAECLDCERRQAGIADYMAGKRDVWWMAPPSELPCAEKLEPRK